MDASRPAYARAGVNVPAADRAVELIRERLSAPGGPDALGVLGGFAAAVPLPGDPDRLLVSSTDGVGTKTAICRALGRFDTIGQDLVGMCADDIVCHGAQPLFFLDYLAVGRVDPETVAVIVDGVARACRAVACALVGGETAEHPGVMEPDAFDLAGFCVGTVAAADLIDGSRAAAGDVVLGLASSGLHANGYSLVRSVLARERLGLGVELRAIARERLGQDAGARVEAGVTLGDALLEPTRLYAPTVLGLRDALRSEGGDLHGVAHVTGGGLAGNLPRAVGPSLGVEVDPRAWPEPVLVTLIARSTGMDGAEARATLNAGIGMAVVLAPDAVGRALAWLDEAGHAAWPIGRVVEGAALGRGRYAEATLR